MASFNYNSLIDDLLKANINFNSDTFKMMLVTSSYVADKDNHSKKSSVTNEVAGGAGYTTGGKTVTLTLTKDLTNDREDIQFTIPSWTEASITARAGVIYKSRGGLSSADELIAYIDFGSNFTSTNGTFLVTMTNPLRFQN